MLPPLHQIMPNFNSKNIYSYIVFHFFFYWLLRKIFMTLDMDFNLQFKNYIFFKKKKEIKEKEN